MQKLSILQNKQTFILNYLRSWIDFVGFVGDYHRAQRNDNNVLHRIVFEIGKLAKELEIIQQMEHFEKLAKLIQKL